MRLRYVCARILQILSKMDGLVNLQNVLVVGMTNRKELLDEALLRPGRMEVRNAVKNVSLAGGAHFLVTIATLFLTCAGQRTCIAF